MKIERVNINGKSYYFVDGAKINGGTLEVVMCGLFGKDVTSKIYRDVISGGSTIVERYIGDGNEALIAQLEIANKKIAALEDKVAQLTIQNLYKNI